ncbi:hypothetical protein D3C76_454400 [compost metagenome]
MLAGVHRAIGEDHVELVLAQLLQQQLVGRFETAQVDGAVVGDDGEQHPAGEALGECIGDADVEQDLALLAVVDDIQHLVGEAEHLVGIAKHQLAQFGGLEGAPLADQQLAAETLLQQLDLTGDGLGSEEEGFRRLGDGALLLSHPKIVKVVVIKV